MKHAVISPASSAWWKVGAISGATAIMLGAFGAHALQRKVKDPKLQKNWETAAHYQLLHSVALLAVPLSKRPTVSGGLIAGGTLIFSGSLYALVLTNERKLGMITPIGGVALVAGWLALLL
ncbi:hypothetical protein P43SY_001550 [Pythium insidiosum]|uniref:Transmembrane protein n=1 Tax=Pythium insidiosum TaxID=114742 RepID=A0AAD5LM39_PYTIN|nr:hypothetical protein P43SY_001550 [Pythium insidiosum]